MTNERLTATAPRRHAHGTKKNELAVMGMDLKDHVTVNCDDGKTRERLLMRCTCCNKHDIAERIVGEKWEPRYYACDQGCNSVLWTPEKERTRPWALHCLVHLLQTLESEMNEDEFVSLVDNIHYLIKTICAPHNPENFWCEAIWGVEHVIFDLEKRLGKTPRVLAANNLLAHVAEFWPPDHAEKTLYDHFSDTFREYHDKLEYEQHKRKHPDGIMLPPPVALESSLDDVFNIIQ